MGPTLMGYPKISVSSAGCRETERRPQGVPDTTQLFGISQGIGRCPWSAPSFTVSSTDRHETDRRPRGVLDSTQLFSMFYPVGRPEKNLEDL